MAETTGIAWTRSTFNAWIGCTEVGPGCDNCYARELDKRHRWGGTVHWGVGVPRHRTGTWQDPIKWNKLAPESEFAGRKGFWPVFCNSLGDFADNEVPKAWHKDLSDLIRLTPHLSWLMATKRVANVAKLYPQWAEKGFPSNVRVILSVVNQDEAARDIPKLLALPCKNGVSYEPALGPVNWSPWLTSCGPNIVSPDPHGRDRALEWVIVGGESTQGSGNARPFDLAWARSTVAQCKAAGVPVFVKQLGSKCTAHPPIQFPLEDRAGADPAEWPEDLRVQEFPS